MGTHLSLAVTSDDDAVAVLATILVFPRRLHLPGVATDAAPPAINLPLDLVKKTLDLGQAVLSRILTSPFVSSGVVRTSKPISQKLSHTMIQPQAAYINVHTYYTQ